MIQTPLAHAEHMAFGCMGAGDATGRALSGVTPQQALDQLIDEQLLAQAAAKAGVEVSDDDVTMALKAGIVAPLDSASTPDDVKAATRAALKAAGTDEAHVPTYAPARDAYRQFLLIQRLETVEPGLTLEQRIAKARAGADARIYPDVLAATSTPQS